MRGKTRALIAAITPGDADEAADQRVTLDWIDSGAALWRTAPPATPPLHLVSYFVPVDGDHMLLVDHRKAGLWLPPGGHVEPGEHPHAAAARECREELGVNADFICDAPLFLTVQRTVGASEHTDISLWFALRADRQAQYAYDKGEFHAIRWFARDALPRSRCAPHLDRFAAKLWPGPQA